MDASGSSSGCAAEASSRGDHGIAVNANGLPSVAKPIVSWPSDSVTYSVSSKLFASSPRAYGSFQPLRSSDQSPMNAPLFLSL